MADVDTSTPHEARVYDYILGGKDNYAVDRAVGDAMLQVTPQLPVWARHNRAFLKRAVTFVAAQGVDQFLDIGTGLPTVENTHEVAERVNPDARVVYVDYDPLVLAHARVLLDSPGTAYVMGDLRRPDEILAQARETLDFDRPIALMLVAILHHLRDDERPYDLVRHVLDALPTGSYLVLSHGTLDFLEPERAREVQAVYDRAPMTMRGRSRAEVERFLDGLEVVEPGVVATVAWRAGGSGGIGSAPDTSEAGHWAAVARKAR
jgi:hypothetical protein